MRNLTLAVATLCLLACESSGSGSVRARFTVMDKFGVPTDQFTVGETITFRLTVSNLSDAPVTYSAPRPRSDVAVERDSAPVWSFHFGKAFPAVVDIEVLEANETVTFEMEWDGTDNQGAQVSPGPYDAVPSLNWLIGDTAIPIRPASRRIVLQ